MNYTAKVLKCDEPTLATGRTYPSKVVKAAIEEYMSGSGKLGELANDAWRVREDNPYGDTISLDRVSHKIVKTYVNEDAEWMAEIEILGTPMGGIAEQMVTMELKPRLTPRAIGILSDDNTVSEMTIIAIDIAGNHESAIDALGEKDV